MAYVTMMSPIGTLTIFEQDGALVALEWGRAVADESQAPPVLDEGKRQLDAYFNGTLKRFDLPLVPGGTEFQERVWRALTDIPYGETRSYGSVATSLGSAPRAVGGACARNPLPILIPCHRVTGSNGSLTGFSAADGIETKRRLLALEGFPAPQSHD